MIQKALVSWNKTVVVNVKELIDGIFRLKNAWMMIVMAYYTQPELLMEMLVNARNFLYGIKIRDYVLYSVQLFKKIF